MAKAIQSVLTKILAAALSLAAVCCVAACGGEKAKNEDVEVTLSKTELELEEGESFRLTVSVSPADAANKHVEWRTSDPMIAHRRGRRRHRQKGGRNHRHRCYQRKDRQL